MKKYTIAIVSFLLGIGFLIVFKLIGAEMAQDGTLIEPFWMVIVGYFFLLISAVLMISMFYKKIRKINRIDVTDE